MDKAFYNLSIVGGEGIYLLVGTKAEYDQIQGQTFSRLPLATKISSINFKALNP
jgi:hypothetical protein